MDMAEHVKRFLKASDFSEGPSLYTIRRAELGKYGRPNLILSTGEIVGLSATNNIALQKAWGSNSDNWIDKEIELSAGEATFQGRVTPTIVIKPISPPLTAAERLAPVATKAALRPIGKAEAGAAGINSEMDDDIPFAPAI
jgi:hypothetical protein